MTELKEFIKVMDKAMFTIEQFKDAKGINLEVENPNFIKATQLITDMEFNEKPDTEANRNEIIHLIATVITEEWKI